MTFVFDARSFRTALVAIALLLYKQAQADDASTPAIPPARGSLHAPEDLALDVVLADPLIAQPVHLSFDERGRLWVVEYRQYPFPAGLKVVSRDDFWRTVYDKVPPPPPRGEKGKDRISIHEDTDGDGEYDKHSVFVDGLNIATAACCGRGGVWVLNPPYLLFYPDADRNDVPDADPTVHLQGFGLEDTHSCVNSLQWGPDGWLYACQGSTVSADVLRPGLDTKPVHSLGQLVWRYHPETKRYEIFAEGGGNAFGLEIDSRGRAFSGHNGGDTRGFHYVQGGYSQKGFNKHGPLSNPFAFGYFPAMRHHSVPRFTHNFVIYEAVGLPERYRGHLFGVEPLQGQVVESTITPDGSTFETKDIQRIVSGDDPLFRPVDIKVGPDGALYVADWRDGNVNHLRNSEGSIDPTNGRVYRVRAKDAVPSAPANLAALGSTELVKLLSHENKWPRRQALRLLADRRDRSVAPQLRHLLAAERGQTALEALWALNAVEALDDETVLAGLGHENPFVRLWAVRLACDDRELASPLVSACADLALREPNVEVRSQLACSARRLPATDGMRIVCGLLAHAEDAADPHVPLLLWWAIEAHCANDREAILATFSDTSLWRQTMVRDHIAARLMRRFAQAGTRRDLMTCAQLLDMAPDKETAAIMLRGFEEAFQGRSLAALPGELVAALSRSGSASLPLRVRQGDADAVTEAVAVLGNDGGELKQRIELARLFGEIKSDSATDTLLALAEADAEPDLRKTSLAALQRYDDIAIARRLAALVAKLPVEMQSLALSVLVSRPQWTHILLEAVAAGDVDQQLVPEAIVRNIILTRDDSNIALVRSIWGDGASASAEDLQAEIARHKAAVNSGSGSPYAGRKLFQAHCAKCHKLYDEGGEVGPDLTAYQRDNLERMLTTIVNPSAEIREGFENFVLQTADGRTLTGFLADQDNQVVVLRTAEGQNVSVPRDEIEQLAAAGQSLMPDGLLKPLSEQEVRDLFAYLRGTQPLALPE